VSLQRHLDEHAGVIVHRRETKILITWFLS